MNLSNWAVLVATDDAEFKESFEASPVHDLIEGEEYFLQIPKYTHSHFLENKALIFKPPFSFSNSWHDYPEEIKHSSLIKTEIISTIDSEAPVELFRVKVVEKTPLGKLTNKFPVQSSVDNFFDTNDFRLFLEYSKNQPTRIRKTITMHEDWIFVELSLEGDIVEFILIKKIGDDYHLLLQGLSEFEENLVLAGNKLLNIEEKKFISILLS